MRWNRLSVSGTRPALKLPGLHRWLKAASVAREVKVSRAVQEGRTKSMGLGGSKESGLPREMQRPWRLCEEQGEALKEAHLMAHRVTV